MKELVANYHAMGCKCIEEKDKARADLLAAREAKFAALEKKDNIERRLRFAIIKRAGGWKELGSNDAARKEALDLHLAKSKALKIAIDAYHSAAAAESKAEGVFESWDDYRKMHQAALYAIGGVRG